tara:strand:- start:30 stop:377 length:348 start_codon:yes stop_codon:yes gene_type:complete
MSWGTKETYIYFREALPETTPTACAWPASKFLGIDPHNTSNTDIKFKALTGHAAVDNIRITHASGKYKELCEALAVSLNSDKNSMVVFADMSEGYDLLSIKLGVGITAVDITYDT